MIRRRKMKRLGSRELRGSVMHEQSGFVVVSSNCRAVLRRRPTRNVSRLGMRGLRWYNLTGVRRRAHEQRLRAYFKQPRARQAMRRAVPLRFRKPQSFVLY